nr:DNA polymerase III subunit alpha [Bacilli bacterium]
FYLGLPYELNDRGYVSFLRNFVEKYPHPLVAFPHYLYEKKGDAIAVEILRAIDENRTLDFKEKEGEQYYLGNEEISSFYHDEEIYLTEEIVKLCRDFTFKKKRGSLLVYKDENGRSDEEVLRNLVYKGLREKGKDQNQEYISRLEYELGVIAKMGYCSYFLIVEDYVRFALDNGIAVGPGRGSGAGSLVSYCLDIVTLDPIENGLMFERFLNPERQSMPDIDVDFADYRRDEVVSYLQRKYGQEHVSRIITFQTLGARASLRDVCRVFGYESNGINDLLKTMPEINPPSLRDCYKTIKRFKEIVDSDPFYLEVVSLAAKIEGLPRQSGVHPAGVVLNDGVLLGSVPIHFDPTWGMVAQFEMNYLEAQGFLKMDILGLSNLAYIDICLDFIRKKGVSVPEGRNLPYRDEKAIALISSGNVMGLFQLESSGMRQAIKELRPTCFEDVAALLALYRPGPMGNIPTYIRRREGKETWTYLSPEMAPILDSTYGIILYQEQITQILTALAGFSYGQADLFRRAISKKDASKMESLKGGFIQGCLNKGKSRAEAEKVYSLIYKFANYGFNKSHAYSYAVITCQMAYLKARYPLEFYAAILEGQSSGDSKFPDLVSEIKNMGFHFLLPSVNHSFLHFVSEGDALRFPLNSIKGINSKLCYDIINERMAEGDYLDVYDFALRCKRFGLSESSFLKLVDAGALDCFSDNRQALRATSAAIIRYAEMFTGSDGNALLLELNFPKPSLLDIPSDKIKDLLNEKESIGMMVSGSLLFTKEEEIRGKGLLSISALEGKTRGNIACIISKVTTIITRKTAKRMAFLTVYDDAGDLKLVCFDEVYNRDYQAIKEGAIVEIEVSKNPSRDEYIAERISLL